MKQNTGFYPRVHVDTAPSAAVGQAGGVLLTQTIAATGLGVALSSALSGWRRPTAVHDPAKVITDLALTLALGGDCMSDIAVLRAEPPAVPRCQLTRRALLPVSRRARSVDGTALWAFGPLGDLTRG